MEGKTLRVMFSLAFTVHNHGNNIILLGFFFFLFKQANLGLLTLCLDWENPVAATAVLTLPPGKSWPRSYATKMP